MMPGREESRSGGPADEGSALSGPPSRGLNIEQAAVFAAEEMIRSAARKLGDELPGLKVTIYTDPLSFSRIRTDRPVVAILDDMGANLADLGMIHGSNPALVAVLLTFDKRIQCSPLSMARREFPALSGVDLAFAVNRGELHPDRIIAPSVRAAEDHLIIEHRAETDRRVFLIVDDEPRWFSQFLPVLYGIIGRQALVKIANTFEEAHSFLFGCDAAEPADAELADSERTGSEQADSEQEDAGRHGRGHLDEVACLIADLTFPRCGKVDPEAGVDLIRIFRERCPGIPVVIASKAEGVSGLKDLGFILPKGDPGSLLTLGRFIADSTGLSDIT